MSRTGTQIAQRRENINPLKKSKNHSSLRAYVCPGRCLRNNFLHDVSGHVCQSKIPAGGTEGQLLVIEPQQSQNGCVEVVDVNFLFGGGKTKFIGCAVDVTGFDP